jgi:predicted enzyme related to lactoylglutathione lyase
MKLQTIYLEVDPSHLAALAEFYGQRLGLDLSTEEAGESIWYDAGGGMRLGFHGSESSESDPGLVNLSFDVDDVDVEAGRLAAEGITIAQGPMDAPWDGTRVAVLFDPVGHTVWLRSPARPS